MTNAAGHHGDRGYRGHHGQRGHRGDAQRAPGYVLVTALVAMAMATLVIGFVLQRNGVRARVVQQQIAGYTEHHEIMAARDLTLVWLQRREERDAIFDQVGTGEPAHQVVLPDGDLVRLYVWNGQGTALANLALAVDDDEQWLMLQLLARLPADRPDLIRRSGPIEMSVPGLSDEMIAALAGSDRTLASALRTLRADPRLTDQVLAREMETLGVDLDAAAGVLDMLVVRPTLFLIEVEFVDAEAAAEAGAPDAFGRYRGLEGIDLKPRRYAVLVRVRPTGTLPEALSWRPLAQGEWERRRLDRALMLGVLGPEEARQLREALDATGALPDGAAGERP